MITYLQHLSFWDWLALATLLLILEVFGAGGYLLWIGLVAVTVGALTYLFPELPWIWQFLLFGTLALLSALLWWRHLHRTSRARN
jgi:membrane protein implicated in regulation of membrane protease activity